MSYSESSVPADHAPTFEKMLALRLEREFPGESFRVYPDWEGLNVMILLTPRALAQSVTPAFDGGRVLGFERRVRRIIDELLRSDEWRTSKDVEH